MKTLQAESILGALLFTYTNSSGVIIVPHHQQPLPQSFIAVSAPRNRAIYLANRIILKFR